jgi:molybdate transport system substrate-binding protein
VERGTAVNAGDVKVLSTHAVFEVMREVGPAFERERGCILSISYDPASVIKRQIKDGAGFDVAIVTKQVIHDLVKQGDILNDTCADIGRSGLGVAIRKGAPKPEIGTVEGFKRAILGAASVVRSKDGTSGLYFEKLLERLGIVEDMRGKIRLGGSGRIAELVAKGEVEMAVQQISELLPVTGADFVGPFPPDLQLYTVFSAGVGAASGQPDVSRALIDALIKPSAIALLKTHGLEPIIR